jgi:hypothetical protein
MPRRPAYPRIRPGHRSVGGADSPAPSVNLDAAVAEINRIYITGGLRTMVAVGRYILDTFFDGDVEAFRSRTQGWSSFKQLYGRADLAMSYTLLGISVNVMLQVEQLPSELARLLNTTQHRALLPVKDLQLKTELARTAVDEGLSSQKLQRRVWEALGPDSPRLGKQPLSPPAAMLRKLDKVSRELVRELEPDQAWSRLSEAERTDLTRKLDRIVGRLTRANDRTRSSS